MRGIFAAVFGASSAAIATLGASIFMDGHPYLAAAEFALAGAHFAGMLIHIKKLGED